MVLSKKGGEVGGNCLVSKLPCQKMNEFSSGSDNFKSGLDIFPIQKKLRDLRVLRG